MKRIAPTAALWVLVIAAPAADPPGVIGHQGRIAVNNANHDGDGYFKFALIDGTGSETYWTNDGSNTGTPGGTPATAVQVPVTKGHYAVLLGDTPMVAVPASVFAANADVRLRTWFGLAAGGPFEMLAPDRRIATAGYAFNAKTAAGIAPGYDTGDSNSLALQTVDSGGTFTFGVAFTEAFAAVPTLEIASGWTVDAVTEAGFTASASLVSRAVDTAGVVGTYTSVATINGRPAVSYRDSGGSALKFARAGDALGTTWPSSSLVTIDGAITDSGDYTSLAEVAGRPAISYYHGSTGDLRFARAANAEGSSWPAGNIITVDGATENVGWYTSLAVIGGVPAISYYAPNAGELRYAWADDAEGNSWPATNVAIVDGSGAPDMGQHSSIIEIGGKPAIAYYNATGANLMFAFLSGSDPAIPADWTRLTVDSAEGVGEYASLAIVDGSPAISYYDATNGNLKFARAGDVAGFSWPVANVVIADGDTSDVGQFSALALFDGRPAISYYDATNKDLKFVFASDAQGTTWPAVDIVTVDGASAEMGSHASMASVNGVPAIAFHEAAGAFDLRFASLPLAAWTASNGSALPVLASGVKDGAITDEMLSSEIGVWKRNGNHTFYDTGRVGVGRTPASNQFEVEGTASKTTAGSWLANSDRRIKTDIQQVGGALQKLDAVRLVSFRYTAAYRAAHSGVGDGRYLNVIAQEFAQVFPEHVRPSGEYLPDGSEILQVDSYPLTIYAAAAVQELHQKLREKDVELEAMRARLDRLEQRLSEDE